MKDRSIVNVAAVTPVVTVADCSANTQAILECIHDAAKANAKIIVLPELCITAYTWQRFILANRTAQPSRRRSYHNRTRNR